MNECYMVSDRKKQKEFLKVDIKHYFIWNVDAMFNLCFSPLWYVQWTAGIWMKNVELHLIFGTQNSSLCKESVNLVLVYIIYPNVLKPMAQPVYQCCIRKGGKTPRSRSQGQRFWYPNTLTQNMNYQIPNS
jgi:hypothetical protein